MIVTRVTAVFVVSDEDGKWVVHSPTLLQVFQVYETLAGNGWPPSMSCCPQSLRADQI